MLLENVATIRTGVVTTRKKAGEKDPIIYEYPLLNLKCAATAGYLDSISTGSTPSITFLNALPTTSQWSNVSLKSSSVSPGKPTITSVVIEREGSFFFNSKYFCSNS